MIESDTQAYSGYVNSLTKAEYLNHWIRNLVSLKVKMNNSFFSWLGIFADRYSDREIQVMHEAWHEY